jgi:thiol:disulfide interchange protein
MTFPLRSAFLSVLIWTGLSLTMHAQLSALGGSGGKHITAELISEQSTVAPGKPFQVKVKLVLDEHWHTYGQQEIEDTKPTALIWTLPEGWKSDPLPWPATKECPAPGGKTIQGYEGTVYLPAKITPPTDLAPGGETKLSVKVDAIVCNLENCIPARNLTASVTVKTGATPVPDTAHADLFKATTEAAAPPPIAAAPAAEKPPLKKIVATLLSEQSSIAPGKPFRVAVKLEVAPTFHTYGPKPFPDTEPTKLDWKLPSGWKVNALPWPATKEVTGIGDEKLPAYEGTVYLPALLTPPATLAPGTEIPITVHVTAKACDDSTCDDVRGLDPSRTLKSAAQPVADASVAEIFKSVPPASAAVAEAAPPTPQAPQENLALYLLFAFIGGLILNIMPCVFPVLAIKVTSVVGQAHDDKGKVLMHGLAYTLGVLVCFWALDGILIAANAGGAKRGWGFQFQEPWFVFGVILVMLVFGLNMAGVFEVGTSAVGVGGNLTSKSGLKGSFFSGLFATVVATPCTAPFLANALTFALSLPPLGSLGIFSCIGLGLAAPYLVLGIFPSLLKKLPRPGAWMESFKQSMSFPMLGAAAYFTWVLLALVSPENGRNILLSLVIIGMACWIYGRWSTISKPTPVRIRALVISLAFFLFGLWLANPKLEAAKTEASESSEPNGLTWKAWSPETVAQLRVENKPVYIDFTAAWCLTCQVNHRVYSNADLIEDFRKHDVTLMKADWTKPDERIEKALADLNESAVPVNILYVPGRDKPVVLPKTLTVSNVQAALAELDKK